MQHYDHHKDYYYFVNQCHKIVIINEVRDIKPESLLI